MRTLAAVLAATALGPACSTPGTTSATTLVTAAPAAPTTRAPSWLLALHAGRGTFVPDGDAWRLTLADVDPTVTAFTDRPSRAVRVIPLDTVVDRWAGAFGDDPPNAAVALDEAASGQDTVVVALGVPRRDATGALSFPAVVLPDDDPGDLAGAVGRTATGSLPPSFGPVSVFVDDTTGSAAGTLTLVVANASALPLVLDAATLDPGTTWPDQPGTGSEICAGCTVTWTFGHDGTAPVDSQDLPVIGGEIALRSPDGGATVTIDLAVEGNHPGDTTATATGPLDTLVIYQGGMATPAEGYNGPGMIHEVSDPAQVTVQIDGT